MIARRVSPDGPFIYCTDRRSSVRCRPKPLRDADPILDPDIQKGCTSNETIEVLCVNINIKGFNQWIRYLAPVFVVYVLYQLRTVGRRSFNVGNNGPQPQWKS